MKNNYFEWSDDICKQIHGVAVGSPLSPVLASLYMEYFEPEILPYLNTQLLWPRYVDDIFIFWSNDQVFVTFFHPSK